jgi:hypothetical protein
MADSNFADDHPGCRDTFVSMMTKRIDAYVEANALVAPPGASSDIPVSPPGEPLRELDLAAAGVTSIIWVTGYRMDFSWILDTQFDEKGFPVHQGGVTPEPGLYFYGLAVAHRSWLLLHPRCRARCAGRRPPGRPAPGGRDPDRGRLTADRKPSTE